MYSWQNVNPDKMNGWYPAAIWLLLFVKIICALISDNQWFGSVLLQECLQPKSLSPSVLASSCTYSLLFWFSVSSDFFHKLFKSWTLQPMGEPQQKCLFSLALATFVILATLHYLQVRQNDGHSGTNRERIYLSDVFISLKTTARLLSCEVFLLSSFIFQKIPPSKISYFYLLFVKKPWGNLNLFS